MECTKIGVIHLNQIGDLLFSLPLLASLRARFPHARIDSILRPGLKDLMEGSHLVDRIIPREQGIFPWLTLLMTLRKQRYDLLVCLARSEGALALACASNAGFTVGFARFPWDIGLDAKETVEGHNSWYNNAKLLNLLNIIPSQNSYVGLLNADDGAYSGELPDRYVVISPGASRRRLVKAWDERKFAEVMAHLHQHYALTPVIVGGSDTQECAALIGMHYREVNSDPPTSEESFDLTGRLSLKELCSVLKKARLFVGIDSGVMHLSSALDIPVVGIFGPTDPFYVGPQNERSIVVRQDISCSPCYIRKQCSHRECMETLPASRVLDACRSLLEGVQGSG
ncbi:MAG: glycosyltransferase family 9 protein [Desulfomonilia bacterium]